MIEMFIVNVIVIVFAKLRAECEVDSTKRGRYRTGRD